MVLRDRTTKGVLEGGPLEYQKGVSEVCCIDSWDTTGHPTVQQLTSGRRSAR
jgi:hypothetical protein